MQDYRKLAVWQKAHKLTLSVYDCTTGFPQNETYGLTAQIRRACISIPANIAEGCGRDGKAEMSRLLQIAAGSASELDYHLLLAHNLKFLTADGYAALEEQLNEVRRMLTTLIGKVRADS
jgi:four helix bundle protein